MQIPNHRRQLGIRRGGIANSAAKQRISAGVAGAEPHISAKGTLEISPGYRLPVMLSRCRRGCPYGFAADGAGLLFAAFSGAGSWEGYDCFIIVGGGLVGDGFLVVASCTGVDALSGVCAAWLPQHGFFHVMDIIYSQNLHHEHLRASSAGSAALAFFGAVGFLHCVRLSGGMVDDGKLHRHFLAALGACLPGAAGGSTGRR